MTTPTADELERRTKALRWFRFRRAFGGHANDADSLVATVRYAEEAELLSLCERLGKPRAELSGLRTLFDVGVYVYVAADLVEITVHAGEWSVQVEDLDAAEALEAAFERAGVSPEPLVSPHVDP